MNLFIFYALLIVGFDVSAKAFEFGEQYYNINNNKVLLSAKTFRPVTGDRFNITLVAMAHVGEKSFYDQVQKIINKADLVLYEDIGGANLFDVAQYLREAPCKKLFASFDYTPIAQKLNLVLQIKNLTYPPNAIIADFTISQYLTSLLKAAGISSPQTLSKTEKCLKADALKGEVVGDIVMVRTRKDIVHILKNLKPKGAGLIVANERNDEVIKALKNQLASRKHKNIVVVYGLFHMDDIENKIKNELKFIPDCENRLKLLSF